jgi:hypothetical protein
MAIGITIVAGNVETSIDLGRISLLGGLSLRLGFGV